MRNRGDCRRIFEPLSIDIPRTWTPEQALALFELLDDLRDKVWALYGDRMQALLREQRVCGDAGKNCDAGDEEL